MRNHPSRQVTDSTLSRRPKRDRLSLWAPHATTVEVELNRHRLPMSAAGRGYWVLDEPRPVAGDRYLFRIDGGPLRPDPRSMRQPEGVHQASEWVEPYSHVRHAEDRFIAPALDSAVIYELHVGTFTAEGTFDAAVTRLDYLKELGVSHIGLMPVAAASGTRGWGYDGVALYAVCEAYGGPDGLQRFVQACHARGLAVVMDVVYNHLGPEGNYLGEFGPYFTDAYKTPWGSAVNLDGPGSDEVRRFLFDNARMWLEDYGCDGLRIDAVHALFDMSALHFLEELAIETDRLAHETGRSLVLIAESDLNDPRLVTPRCCGGYGLDAQWSDDFHHALHVALTAEQQGYYKGFTGIEDLATSLREVFIHAGDYSAARGRRHGRPVGTLPGCRFLAYSQNHDQVGNRARGERLCHLVSPAHARIAAALTVLAPFVPMLFQGEEWAASSPFLYFTDHGDADLGAAVKEGRRREFSAFGWKPEDIPDPQLPQTYNASVLDWREQSVAEHAEMLDWYRRLLALRRSEDDLRYPDRAATSVTCDPEAGWLQLRRGAIDIVAAFADRALQLRLNAGRPLLCSQNATLKPNGELQFSGPGVAVSRRARA
ncbi:MAG: malto-oligosyltrehalose trehalohydrolase [Spirochaetaceae bacterium]|nr:MAG: malto-oligosyltrehalose trehalohydrolase [Spirochaetaceae bacterium]